MQVLFHPLIADCRVVIKSKGLYTDVYLISILKIFFLSSGTKNLLQSISEKQGLRMNSAESKAEIPKFIEYFQARIMAQPPGFVIYMLPRAWGSAVTFLWP